ncbi:Ribulose-5-phosphate 4-epimerase/Fuculose-1-phosphate aldolase [Cohaesibacter marisflavi]|uniref:Ribulose-5-phosphate 4-epimerase/Fuculose-1-phosphate aldolase n=2 Tax=Cohaesibacter marisflavi TaxID=655353 RepID=A0A1I5LL31_9HYPH|nr:class II aldolase/adducin family protein [Cohaesibacter marisflavi]SFO97461.1 Ribulose-5-phosphate 4-epimerase/Fuculose-1-phosphate aldolase [Cohaesibacter marisflavi]
MEIARRQLTGVKESKMEASKTLSDFIALCHKIYAHDFVPGSGGNASIRLGDRIVITPSGISLGKLEETDLVSIAMDGSVIGKGKPSKEWRMHMNCYERADVNAVIHVHSPYAVAIACLKELDTTCAMPVYTPGYSVRVGALPVVPYYRAGSTELADSIIAIMAHRNSLLLENHGLLTVGVTMDQAFNLVEEVEENAHLHFTLGGAGKPLTREQQEDLTGKY